MASEIGLKKLRNMFKRNNKTLKIMFNRNKSIKHKIRNKTGELLAASSWVFSL